LVTASKSYASVEVFFKSSVLKSGSYCLFLFLIEKSQRSLIDTILPLYFWIKKDKVGAISFIELYIELEGKINATWNMLWLEGTRKWIPGVISRMLSGAFRYTK
jgi:hypothetical protein